MSSPEAFEPLPENRETSPGFPDFTELASQLGILSREAAAELSRAASAAGVTAVEYGLMKTALQPGDADILRTLLDPQKAIPGFEVLNLLGRGGMGVVYRARQKSLDRHVALKTILLSQLANPVAAQRFEQEARSLARLAHPHIVAVYDLGRVADRLFFSMELIEGEDVDQLVRRVGALDENLTWNLIRQAAAGLAHAANAGIVHRDIKPANLLLVTPPEGFPLPPRTPLVKIADFGLALLTALGEEDREGRLTSENVQVGSPIYMAPEQIRSGAVDHRADIFSLGITAWHMLAGHPPRLGKTLTQILSRRLSEPTESVAIYRDGLSRASTELVAAMLHPDPDQRVRDYATLLAQIDQLIGSLAVAVDPGATIIVADDSGGRAFETALQQNRRLASAELTETAPATPRPQAAQPKVPRVPRPTRRAWLLGMAALTAGGAGYFTWKFRPKPRPIREWKPGAAPIPIFNGESLAGWNTLRGSWRDGADEEGGRVLIGENGAIAYHFALEASPPPTNNYFRFECSVDFQNAEEVEIETDFSSADPRRLVVRISKSGAQFGVRDGDKGSLQKAQPVGSGFDAARGIANVMLERQPTGWWIVFDGDVVGIAEHCHSASLIDLHLTVNRGKALFGDLLLELLSPPN